MADTSNSSIVRLESEVAAALGRAGYSGKDNQDYTSLVVGVSGGPDSAALIHCLHRLKDAHRLRLYVAHLNHNFRGQEAYDDARFVSDLALDLGLEATVEQRDVLAYQRERRISSFEQAAREFRYRFLAEVAESVGAAAVAVAHTSDDLAETVLLHILRGSGTGGLRGMSELSPWPWPRDQAELKLFRPLLGLSKTTTVGYCRELGKDYREDSGNYLPRFTRNRVRLNLLPLLEAEFNPRVRESLIRLSRTASLELDYLDGETDRLWGQVATEANGGVDFRQSDLAQVHPALLKLLLRKAYSHVAGDARRLSQPNLDAMTAFVHSNSAGRSVDLPGGLKLHRSYDYLRMSRESSLPCPFPVLDEAQDLSLPTAGGAAAVVKFALWEITLRNIDSGQIDFRDEAIWSPAPILGSAVKTQMWKAYLGRDALGDGLRVRSWLPGDRFQPLGLANEKKLQDFFTDARVPKDWRNRVPLLVADRGIAWVVGYRIAQWARVISQITTASPAVEVAFSYGGSS
ncbi:MAG: tRNA lysidine(34) synthetase TilS [SAR202 cluster bacterium Io17-Chloro-G7]|nr:MAG: tRNA lysidine(34) synthetase TilS [SAR202 cluster bacterium Io17-Chloro-G7]